MTGELLLITGLGGEIGQSLSQEFNRRKQGFLRLEDYFSAEYKDIKPKRLIHLAGYADESNPQKLINANIDYLKKVIDNLSNTSVEEVIFFSSATVYGNQNKEDVSEEDALISPGLYGCSKLVGEQLLANSNLRSLCLRLPGVLELRNSTTFLSKTFTKVRTGSDICIYNGSKIYNNFISVPILADFIINSKLYKQHDIINLASKKELTLFEIVNLLKKNLSSPSNIVEFSDETDFFNLSINKSIEKYKFFPGISEDTLVSWCKSRVF